MRGPAIGSSVLFLNATKPATNTLAIVQGMEKAVIILSTAVTRAGAFASDARRLNVALTRAKRHLIIVGEDWQMHISTASALTAVTIHL